MNERRQHFRIQQDVIFNFQLVTTDSINHMSAEQHFDHSSALALFSQFQKLDNDTYQLLNNIKLQDQNVGNYLEMLNHKVNILSQQMLANEAVSVKDRESGRIDLSQGGLRFNHHSPIGIESWLAVKLVFTPSYSGVITYAQVTRCQALDDDNYLIGVRFHQLNQEQERILAKQIMRTQIVQKRHQQNAVHH